MRHGLESQNMLKPEHAFIGCLVGVRNASLELNREVRNSNRIYLHRNDSESHKNVSLIENIV